MITNKTPYHEVVKHLKETYGEDFERMPQTLNGSKIYYADIKFSAKFHISTIEQEYANYGKQNIRRSEYAKRSKDQLVLICQELENKENWNKRPEYE